MTLEREQHDVATLAGSLAPDYPAAVGSIDPHGPFIQDAPVAIYVVDLTGRVIEWNRACERLFGWEAHEILGEVVPFIPPEKVDELTSIVDQLTTSGTVGTVEYRPVCRDGSRRDVLSSATVVTDDRGDVTGFITFAMDISEQREAAEVIAGAEQRWRTLLESTNDTVSVVDVHGRVVETSGRFADPLGYGALEWEELPGLDLIHPDDRPLVYDLWRWVLEHPATPTSEVFRTRHNDGHWELLEYSVANKIDDPLVRGIVVTTHNVTDVRLAEALVSDEAAVLELVARNAPLPTILDEIVRMVEFHTAGRVSVNVPDSAGATRCSPGIDDVLEAMMAAGVAGACKAALESGETVIIEDVADNELTGPDCTLFTDAGIHSTWSQPIIDTGGSESLGSICIYYPDTRRPTPRELDVVGTAAHLAAIAVERDRAQRRLEHQARHDQLTALPNRWAIVEHLDRAVAAARERDSGVAVLLIDLDRFKLVNDSLGHQAGDALLIAFGERLRSLVQPDDFVGHFGADEFVVVIGDVIDIDEVHRVASRLDLALSEPFTIPAKGSSGDHEVYVSASIGVALGPAEANTGQELLQQADTAMFQAKDHGRDRLEVFDDGMREQAAEQLRVDRELRLAIERAELRVHYQPTVDLASDTIVGAEALLRWEHPERGTVTPAEFIGLAEETGLIVRIGAWVLDEAVRQARTWCERMPDIGPFTVAVNLSARQLTSATLVGTVQRALDRYGWPPAQLVLELTESILIDDADAALGVLRQLKGLGVKLAIDDFGTGYSSLGYLHRFPFDIVKVDRAFVATLGPTGDGSAVTAAVMHMARALGLSTVAEGVETPDQLAGLRALGCDTAQGYHLARPLPAHRFTALLREKPSW